MAKPAALARARREVASRAAAGGDSRTLRADILDLLRPAVGFDAYAWLLTDPQTCVGSSALADVPRLPELPRLIRLKYLTDVARWTALGPESVTRLRTATGGDRTRSLLWRELQSDWDVGDVASAVQQDRYGCWGFLDLWRSGSDASFTDDEAALLADVADVVTAALRRTVADALVATTTATPTATTPSGPAVLLLSADLQVQGQTPPAQEYLRSIVPTSVGAEPVPSVAYNVAAQLLAREAGVDDHPPWARVHLAGNQLMTVRADRLSSARTRPTERYRRRLRHRGHHRARVRVGARRPLRARVRAHATGVRAGHDAGRRRRHP